MKRLELLNGYLRELKSLRSTDTQTYTDNFLIRRAVERTLQLAAESSLDIGHQIIAREGFRRPDDNKDVFVILNEEGLLPSDLLLNLIQMARFRNLIVHDYATIDDLAVHTILQTRLGDFDRYAQAIVAYLSGSKRCPSS